MSIRPPASIHFIHPRRPIQSRFGKPTSIFARLDKDVANAPSNELNLSVLRFTLGIRGLESLLHGWTEDLGLSMAACSPAHPYFGRFLKGSTVLDQGTLPDDSKQIFVMPDSCVDNGRDDLAWATYVLLRNTNSTSVIISAHNDLYVRGYWSTPDNVSKGDMLSWFSSQLSGTGLSDLRDVLYFPHFTGFEQWKMLPKGTQSLIVHPIVCTSMRTPDEGVVKYEGFAMLASN